MNDSHASVTVLPDYDALSRAGADRVVALAAANPMATLLLATGQTPMGIYQELVVRRQRGEFNASRLRIFQLDEYLGIPAEDRRSLYRWLDESFLTPLGVPAVNVVRLPGNDDDPDATCRAYDQAVSEAGGFDLSLLGLGPNGHLGFNEPPSDPRSPTRVVTLTPESIASNARYWGEGNVPSQALTAGMQQLLAAKQTLLVVSGTHKRTILHRTLAGPVSPDVPASYLTLAPNVEVLADRAAWEEPDADA